MNSSVSGGGRLQASPRCCCLTCRRLSGSPALQFAPAAGPFERRSAAHRVGQDVRSVSAVAEQVTHIKCIDLNMYATCEAQIMQAAAQRSIKSN